jgi:hypothetical protein
MKLDSIIGAAILAAAIVTLPAVAADSNVSPAQGTQGNVSFVSGGVGEDEAAAMKSAAAGYPLELQFVQKASPRDEFLADVTVRITDRSKNVVLDTVTTGPFLLAKLPSGTYQVEADHRGVMKRQTVDIRSGKHQRTVFVWTPSADEIRQSMLEQADSDTALR